MNRSALALAASTFAAIAFASGVASAGGAGVEVSVNGVGAAADLDQYKLHAGLGTDVPDPLKDKLLALNGLGQIVGGELRLTILGDGGSIGRGRGGLGIGAFGINHVGFQHDPLTRGVTASAGSLWGIHTDIFFGREFEVGHQRDAEGFTTRPYFIPYVDLRFLFSIMQTQIKLHYDALGDLGSTIYNAYSFGIGPRFGILVPMGTDAFLDFGGYGNLFGMERIGGYAGIGIWDR